jgi:hypothetical protein
LVRCEDHALKKRLGKSVGVMNVKRSANNKTCGENVRCRACFPVSRDRCACSQVTAEEES